MLGEVVWLSTWDSELEHGAVVVIVVGLPLESVVVMWDTTSVSTLPLDFVTTVV